MKIDTIQNLLAELNAATSKPKVIKKVPAALADKPTNGHTVLSTEESLVLSAKRIAAAFDLQSRGVTPEIVVARVHLFEKKAAGAIQ